MTSNASSPVADIPIPSARGSLIFRTGGTEIEFIEGRVVVHKGTVAQPHLSAKAEFTKALKSGDIITDGSNAGWIYCDGGNVDPFLVAPKDSGVMTWRNAMEFLAREQSELPTTEQLYAMFDARNKGALSNSFNESGSESSGWYRTGTRGKFGGRCIRFSDGSQSDGFINLSATVRLVRSYTPV